MRLGEAEIDLSALKTSGEAKPDILAFAHQIALGDADVADDAFARGVARAEGQLAGGLLLNLDDQTTRSGALPGSVSMSTRLEEAERAQAPPRRLDEQPIVGVALGETELAANHVVMGAEIADDVDALDIDVRTFVDRDR